MQRSAPTIKNKNFSTSNIKIDRYIDFNTIMFVLMGFLLSRSILIGAVAPLGVAFFICIAKIDKYRIPVFLSALMGIILSFNNTVYMIKYAVCLMIFMIISKKLKEINSTSRMALIGTAIVLPISIGQALLSNRTVYDFFMCGVESIIVFVAIYTFSFGVNLINNSNSRISIKTEETISISLLMVFSIMGIGNIALFGISVRAVLSTMLILVAAIVGGETMGATSGVIVGIAFLINNVASSIYMGIYAFAGLVGGAFNKINKYVCILGYILSWVIIYAYTSGIDSNIMELRDILLASLIVILLPNKFFEKVEKIIKSNVASNEVVYDYITRTKNVTNNRLVSIYKTYDELANTFDRIREKDKILDQRDIASVIDMIHNDECKGCGMKRMCWESRFQHTYSMIYNILEILEEKGQVTINDLPEDFKKECLRAEPIVKISNYYYKMFVLDYNWNVKFSESRKLIADQIRSISKSIEGMSKDFENSVILDLEKEKNIYDELQRHNIDANKVNYMTSGEDDFEITIENRVCSSGSMCDEAILDVVSNFTGETLSMQKMGCSCLGEKCSVKFTKAQKYKAITNVSSMSRDGHILCGDNYTYMDINDGK
ncbi:stage II sporulation protein E, partial [Romboutsia weinsteinii]